MLRSVPDAAHGVFETLLVRAGRPVELDAHLARLGASAGTLFAEPVPPYLRDLARDAARGTHLGRLRLTLAPGHAGTLVAELQIAPVEPRLVLPRWEDGARLRPFVVPGGLGAHKWADRRLLQRAEAGAPGFVALLLDTDGTVLEVSRANVLVVEGGAIVTPPADGRILPGVTRRRVLELARVREEAVPLDRLVAADEVFLTGSVRGIEPVRGCDRRRDWLPGTVTPRISDRLARHWERDR